MNILAIESSCDETAAAVVRDGRTVLSNCIASQIEMHTIYGGVVPEIASRKHVEAVTGLAEQAVAQAGLTKVDLDAVAVTYAPGLIGAVLVGVNFAKGAAMALDLPLIPVHHVRGHIAANYITHPELEPPFVCLCVSGGTTLIVDVKSYTDMEVLGGTRDDAAGECFDKVARVLGIGYPGGGPMDRLARGGDDGRYELPRAHVAGHDLDMSFSGLKTASLPESDPQRPAEGGGAEPARLRRQLRPGGERVPGAPGDGRRPHEGVWPGGGGRGRGGQQPHPGGPYRGLPGERRPAVPARAEILRRQRRHDRVPRIL